MEGTIESEEGVNVIADGFLCMQGLDEEEGTEYFVRYTIKNWDQIKENIQ